MHIDNARKWRVVLGGGAAAIAGVLGLATALGSTTASADPVTPDPAPVTVTQTVTVAPGQPVATPVTPVQPALQPASSGTLTEFFDSKGVTMEPQQAADFKALSITLPMPAGWSQVPDPNVPDAFAVIADRAGGDGLYTSNAQLTVYKLVGDFDPREAITHGFIDAQALSNWQTTDASLAPFNGFPSSRIDGTFRENDNVVNTSRRHVIATSGTDHYLVSLSVNTSVTQVVASATATDAILNGFRVVDPSATPAVPLQVPGQPTTPGPSATPGQPGVAGQPVRPNPAGLSPAPSAAVPGATSPGLSTPGGAVAGAPTSGGTAAQLVPVAQTPLA